MTDVYQKIKELKEEIKQTPYHKGTEHHIGRLKAKIARLENELEAKSKKSRGGGGFAIRKSGDAQVVLIGPPSVGKSTLLNKLTAAKSRVGSYDFTTVRVIPGMMEYQGAKIQILDLPGIIKGASLGKGHGRQILSVVRSADLLIVMTDVTNYKILPSLLSELDDIGIRVNQTKPAVYIKKRPSGGLHIRHTKLKENLDKFLIKKIASEFRLVNAEIIIKEELGTTRLIDAFSENRVYIPTLLVINKLDLVNPACVGRRITFYNELKIKWRDKVLLISAKNNINLSSLKSEILSSLKLIRIYLKPKKEKEIKSSIIVKEGTTIQELAQKVSTEVAAKLKGAQIWQDIVSKKFRLVGKDYIVFNNQIVALID